MVLLIFVQGPKARGIIVGPVINVHMYTFSLIK